MDFDSSILHIFRTNFFFSKNLSVFFTFFLITIFFFLDNGVVQATTEVENDSDGADYLTKFGWLTPQDPKTGSLRTRAEFEKAIKTFQRFASLNVTGKLDAETIKMMNTPRCGVSDTIGLGVNARRRKKRYTLQGSRWGRNNLSYKIIRYTRDLTPAEVDRDIRLAFKIWADVTPLRFTQISFGKADIEIAFLDYDHGDGIPFDGKAGTLAHAYFPVYGGDAHFDDGETWTVNTKKGTNLFQVAAHEFGHSLGLSHSDIRQSLMAPFYRGYDPTFVLHVDDILGVQELYGPNPDGAKPDTTTTTEKPVSKTIPPPPPPGVPDACLQTSIDTITQTANGLTYAFKGDYYWRLNRRGYDAGYPRRINWDWRGLPGNLDAALHMRHSGYTFFFKNDVYWKFFNMKPISGYPKKISWGFPGIPSHIDAAFVWTGNGKAYFIKGYQYWKYGQYKVEFGYPRPLAVWKGLPRRVNAAFQYRTGTTRRTYFYDGPHYYRFNDRKFRVDEDYPRLVAEWWFGCRVETERYVAADADGTHAVLKAGDIRGDDADDQWIDVGVDDNSSTSSGARVAAGSTPAQRLSSFFFFFFFFVISSRVF